MTTDLSETGLQLQGNRILRPGSEIVLGVSYGQNSFTGRALVRWTRTDTVLRSGLQFVGLDEDGHQAVRETLNVKESPVLNIQNLVSASGLSGECPVNGTISEFYRRGDFYHLRLDSGKDSLMFAFCSASHSQMPDTRYDVSKYQLVRTVDGNSVHRFFNREQVLLVELQSRGFQVASDYRGTPEEVRSEGFSLKSTLDKLIQCLARGEMDSVAEEAGRMSHHILAQSGEEDQERLRCFQAALRRRQYPRAGKLLAILTSRHHNHTPLSVRGMLLRMSYHLADERPVLCLTELENLRDYLFAVR